MIEALEIAFQKIDTDASFNAKHPNIHIKNDIEDENSQTVTDFNELEAEIFPFYENVDEVLEAKYLNEIIVKSNTRKEDESNHKSHHNNFKGQRVQKTCKSELYYETPNKETYYEVPKTNPIPLYENMQSRGPPREKPPPPPEENLDEFSSCMENNPMSFKEEDTFKRVNSTKRIRNELWNKRSCFLGFQELNDTVLDFNVLHPPHMSTFSEKDKKEQRHLIKKTGFSDNSDTGNLEKMFIYI